MSYDNDNITITRSASSARVRGPIASTRLGVEVVVIKR